jgi:hypothetical protein
MTLTTNDATRSPEHKQTFEEARVEPLTEEQFYKELHNDLEAMLSQEPRAMRRIMRGKERKGEQREEQESLLEATKKMMMVMKTRMTRMKKTAIKVLRILSHVNSNGGQRRMSWTRTLTQNRRYRDLALVSQFANTLIML